MKITEIPVSGYEKVVKAEDSASGLHAFIAVHSTTLGPALGGMRMWPYKTEQEALTDVLRLSRGMTYKSAVADTGLGGGKSVIIGDPAKNKSEALFRAMGKFINSLEGRYITAEDVGTTIPDLDWVRKETKWVTGLSRESGGSGNPSPYTALGCLYGLRASVEHALNRKSLDGLHVALQGVGAVGSAYAKLLAQEGARITIADLRPQMTAALAKEIGAQVVTDEEIFAMECDVLAPCALGGILNEKTIPKLRCKVIAGCSNNQLLEEARDGEALMKRGILYAPDYVINAGGIINVSCELIPGGYNEQASLKKIHQIYDHLKEVFAISKSENIPTHRAADRLAENRLRAKSGR